MSLPTAFGEVLRELRMKRGYSQEALALECGLDRTYISLLERGLRQPTLTTIFTLAEILEVSPANLVTRTEKRLNS